jgi:hypothetical protein
MADGTSDDRACREPAQAPRLDYSASIVRNQPERRELMMARWGMQMPPFIRPSWRGETFSCESKKGKSPAFVP